MDLPPVQPGYSGSTESSPRGRTVDPWDDVRSQTGNSKLRLMCSYGGHIAPRPHHNSLSYLGGDTRIVSFDRASTFTHLTSKLSKTLISGQPFTLKYQIPNHGLDSLISVTSDEDLENMIHEYDRTKPSRIRLFLFTPDSPIPNELDHPGAFDSLMGSDLENSSSFGSTSSSCMANLPPIRVRVHDTKDPLPNSADPTQFVNLLSDALPEKKASTDSASSDGSLTKPAAYQDSVAQTPTSGSTNTNKGTYDSNPRSPTVEAQDPGYMFTQFDQLQLQQKQQQTQQYIYTNPHYLHHQNQPNRPIQIPSYYPAIYPSQQHPYEQNYGYYMPARPQNPTPTNINNQIASSVQVLTGQYHQQQYLPYSPIHLPGMPNSDSATNSYAAYEYGDSNQGQMYYAEASHQVDNSSNNNMKQQPM